MTHNHHILGALRSFDNYTGFIYGTCWVIDPVQSAGKHVSSYSSTPQGIEITVSYLAVHELTKSFHLSVIRERNLQ